MFHEHMQIELNSYERVPSIVYKEFITAVLTFRN